MASTRDVIPAKTRSKPVHLIWLVLGDGWVFLLFATIGWFSHGKEHPLLWVWATSGAPFAIAWFAVAPFFGVYRQSITSKTRSLLLRVALAWLCAWPIGWLLRWLFAGEAPVSFAITTLIFTMIFLQAWRGLFALAMNRRR